MLSSEELMVLHRQWMWANVMRESFYAHLGEGGNAKPAEEFFPDRVGGFMCVWYGMLFSVLEVVKEKSLAIEGIEDLDTIYEPLRLFRNAVFHAQPKYWSPKLFEIMKDPESALKIRKIHSALGKFFLTELRNRREKQHEEGKTT